MWSNEWQIKGSLPSACCLINTGSMLFAISVARVHSWLTFSSISAGHLRPFPAELLHSQCPVGIFSRSTSFPYAELCTCLWISWGFFQLQLISFSEDLLRRLQTQCSTRTLSSKWPLSSDRLCSFELFYYIYTKEAFLKILLSRPFYIAPVLSSQYLRTPSAL